MPVKDQTYSKDVAKRFILAIESLKGEALAKDIVKKIGISQSYLSQVRSGVKMMTIDHIVRLCSYYKFSSEWLLLGRGEMRWDKKTLDQDGRLDRMEEMIKKLESLMIQLFVDKAIK